MNAYRNTFLILEFTALVILNTNYGFIKFDINQDKEHLIFGSGGGFTGIASSYVPERNGNFYITGSIDFTLFLSEKFR